MDTPGKDALTAREAEILRLLRELSGCRQIAARLGIAEMTVRKHRANICAKLGCQGTAALLAAAHGPPMHGTPAGDFRR